MADRTSNDVAGILGDYEQDGHVRVRGFLTPTQVAEVRENLARYTRDIVPGLPTGDRTFEADGTTVRNLWRMDRHDAYFKQLAIDPTILALVGKLVHGEPLLMGVETFNKPAKIGSGVPHHQDNAYFCQSPPDALTIWISIDPATMENGPIYYVTGSHAKGMVLHAKSGVAGNSMGVANPPAPDPTKEFCGTLDAGDALIHHCQTIHYSAPNKSDHARCGLLFVYRGTHTKTDDALKQAYAAPSPAAKPA